jgi:hypothetical protein
MVVSIENRNFMKIIGMFLLTLGLITIAFLAMGGDHIGKVAAQEIQLTQEGGLTFFPFVSSSISSVPSPTPVVTPGPTLPTPNIPEGLIYVDHRSVELFERIPDQYLAGARDLRMVFADRSVGDNINRALDCLSASSWAQAPAYCRRDYTGVVGSTWNWKTFGLDDFLNNRVPERILFAPDPSKYNRSNWTYDWAVGTWDEIVAGFMTQLVPQYINNKDVLSFQFSYLNIGSGENIADPAQGFFVDLPSNFYGSSRVRWDISDLEELESRYPNKIFIYWTTSLSRSLGSQEGLVFNNQMREYAIENEKILFDVAAILSHDDRGNPCYDNRDSVQYCTMSGSCENYPDDGRAFPAICQDYTTETEGGHLGSVSAGGIRVAKAFWVLMSQIAGWGS